MNKFVVLLLLLVCSLFCCADVQLEVLGPSELLCKYKTNKKQEEKHHLYTTYWFREYQEQC